MSAPKYRKWILRGDLSDFVEPESTSIVPSILLTERETKVGITVYSKDLTFIINKFSLTY